MGTDLTGKKVVFLGAGKMGGIILQALLKNGLLSAKSTCATVAHEERAKALAAKPVSYTHLRAHETDS